MMDLCLHPSSLGTVGLWVTLLVGQDHAEGKELLKIEGDIAELRNTRVSASSMAVNTQLCATYRLGDCKWSPYDGHFGFQRRYCYCEAML